MPKRDWAALFAMLLASAVLSLFQGQDINFDQRQYHFYQGWALLTGRLDLDVAPAAGGTFLNPLIHLPTYLGIRYLPPRVFGALLGAVQGLNLFLVYLIALRIVPAVRQRRIVAALAAAMAAVGPLAVSLVGTTFGDNLVSVPMLASVLVLACAVESADRRRQGTRPRLPLGLVALSAALAGAAAGLKLTFALFCVPLALVVLGLAVWARSWRVVLVFAVAGASGFGVVSAYWAYQLWIHFSNPLFPYANGLFQSPYYASWANRDPLWAPRGWINPLGEAFAMAVGRTQGLQQVEFADSRYLVTLWLIGVVIAFRFLARRDLALPVVARVVVLYWFASYVVWLGSVHYYRYFAVGEYLAPVAMLVLIGSVMRRRLLAVWLPLVLAVGLTSHTGSWGRMPWGRNWYGVRLASPPEPGAAVMVDGGLVAFVLPYFPEGTRFYWIPRGNFRPLSALVAGRLGAHRGPVYRLKLDWYPPTRLDPFGLVDADDCAAVRTRGTRLVLCRLERTRRFP